MPIQLNTRLHPAPYHELGFCLGALECRKGIVYTFTLPSLFFPLVLVLAVQGQEGWRKKRKHVHLTGAIAVPWQIVFPSLWQVSKYWLSGGGLFYICKWPESYGICTRCHSRTVKGDLVTPGWKQQWTKIKAVHVHASVSSGCLTF